MARLITNFHANKFLVVILVTSIALVLFFVAGSLFVRQDKKSSKANKIDCELNQAFSAPKEERSTIPFAHKFEAQALSNNIPFEVTLPFEIDCHMGCRPVGSGSCCGTGECIHCTSGCMNSYTGSEILKIGFKQRTAYGETFYDSWKAIGVIRDIKARLPKNSVVESVKLSVCNVGKTVYSVGQLGAWQITSSGWPANYGGDSGCLGAAWAQAGYCIRLPGDRYTTFDLSAKDSCQVVDLGVRAVNRINALLGYENDHVFGIGLRTERLYSQAVQERLDIGGANYPETHKGWKLVVKGYYTDDSIGEPPKCNLRILNHLIINFTQELTDEYINSVTSEEIKAFLLYLKSKISTVIDTKAINYCVTNWQ